jgi:hypothetical protein
LLAVGRDKEAISILEQAARRNKLDTEGIAQKVESARTLKVGLTLIGVKELSLYLISYLFKNSVKSVFHSCVTYSSAVLYTLYSLH